MKLSLASHHRTITIETEHDDVTMDELFKMFAELSLAAGFAPQTVADWFDDEAWAENEAIMARNGGQ